MQASLLFLLLLRFSKATVLLTPAPGPAHSIYKPLSYCAGTPHHPAICMCTQTRCIARVRIRMSLCVHCGLWSFYREFQHLNTAPLPLPESPSMFQHGLGSARPSSATRPLPCTTFNTLSYQHKEGRRGGHNRGAAAADKVEKTLPVKNARGK